MATSMGPEHGTSEETLDVLKDLPYGEVQALSELSDEKRAELQSLVNIVEQKTLHSDVQGLENPFDPDSKISDSPILDADDMPQTMDYTDDERALAREVQAKEGTGKDVKKGIGTKTKLGVVAGAVGLAAVGLIAALTGKGDSTEGNETPSTAVNPDETPTQITSPTTSQLIPETESGNIPTESLPEDIEIPSSEDAGLLTEQLYINLQNALNTNNPSYLDFRYAAGLESELAEQVLVNMRQAADYRNQGNPDYGYVFETEVLGAIPENFTSSDSERSLTVAVTETEILDSSGASREYNYIHELRLRKVQKFINSGDGPEAVDVWLISYLDHQGNVVNG